MQKVSDRKLCFTVLSSNCTIVPDDFLAHIPDITTSTGLLDIVMVGNVLEFSDALSRPYYAGKVSKEVVEEENVARWRYRQLIKWFSSRYVLVFDGKFVNPWYLVHMSLAQFSATLIAYMETWEMKAAEAKGCTPKRFRLAVFNHLRRQWLELVPKFDQLSKGKASQSLAWDGPKFEVLHREEMPQDQISSELRDLESFKVFVGDVDEEEIDAANESESDLTELEGESDDENDSEKESAKERSAAGVAEQDQDGEEERPAVDEDDDMDVDEETGSKRKTSKKSTQSRRRPRSKSNGEWTILHYLNLF
jgi:hypothetical protein